MFWVHEKIQRPGIQSMSKNINLIVPVKKLVYNFYHTD